MKALIMAAMLLAQGPGTPRTATGVIAGRIRSTDGSPAAGLRVSALAVPDSTATAMIASLGETDASGRYRLEGIPPGRYYIMAGSLDFASYFPGVKNVADGLVVTLMPGAALAGVDFALARPAGIRISGRVRGLPAGGPAGLVRVLLNPQGAQGGSGPQDVPVQADGTFEFVKVTPGRYVARLNPAVPPVSQVQLQVDDQDIIADLTMGTAIIGRVVVDDGSTLPVQMAALAAGTPDPPALVGLRGRRVSATQPILNNGRGAVAQAAATPRADGYFLFPAGGGEYEFAPTQMPFGYALKSVAIDPVTAQMRVTLTTTPAQGAPGVTVRGRITGLAASPAGTRWIILQMAGGANSMGIAEQRIGQAPIREDGSFEISRVPPGTATFQLQSAPAAPTQLNMRLDIADRDVSIVLAITSAEAAPDRPTSPGILIPAAPFTVVVPDITPTLP